MRNVVLLLAALTASILWSCSVTPKKEADKNVKEFLMDFQANLAKSDEEILKMFSSDQYKDQILRGIELLRNKEKVVVVSALFDEAKQYAEDYYVLIDIPVDLSGDGQPTDRTFFSLRVVPKNGSFIIIGMDVDRFFPAYFSMKSTIENSDELSQLRAELQPYYDRAKELQKNYDSVIWFANYDSGTYFYVVNGAYNFDSLKKGSSHTCKMGLVNNTGKVIVPVEYDLVKNPSMSIPDAVEVSKDGKVGYYSIEGKELIPAAYDWVVPYKEGEAVALVLKDSVYGWLDNSYQFHKNFPTSRAEESIREFRFLASHTFTIETSSTGIINLLTPLRQEFIHQGNGLVLPSAYFVKLGIFPEYNDRFITRRTNNLYQFGNDLMETKSEGPLSITEALSVFITSVKTRFIGGRGEFYSEQRLTLLDRKKNPVSSFKVANGKDFSFKKIGDSLYQYTHLVDYAYEMGPGDGFPEQNFPYYGYFKFDGRKTTDLNSTRRFAFSQFVKMDSSFLTGSFDVWDGKVGQTVKSSFLSTQAIGFMRDEILAGYGFTFKNLQQSEQFKYAPWYKPTIDSYDEVYGMATEIDKHNLDFLNRMIGLPGASSM